MITPRGNMLAEPSGIIFDIKRYAIHDGPGIRTTVFLKGCPLNCIWCHNPESRRSEPEPVIKLRMKAFSGNSYFQNGNQDIGIRLNVQQVLSELRKDEIFYSESGGGITFSGGEPLQQLTFLAALLEKAAENGWHTAVDTCGYAPWDSFERVLPLTRLFLFDLKIMDNQLHKKYTGKSNDLILQNLQKLSGKAPLRIRIPLIQNITDTEKNLNAIKDFLSGLPQNPEVDLLPNNFLAQNKYRQLNQPVEPAIFQPYPPDRLSEIEDYFRESGYPVQSGG
ncbi:MAG: glycyl-radical enzyme activating protein [Calditrichia bacterium]